MWIELEPMAKKSSGTQTESRTAESRTDSEKQPKASAALGVVTIDGPAASGKSSVSRELARRLGWDWVSTGTFYRGLAWAANDIGIDISGQQTDIEPALVALAKSGRCRVRLTAQTTCFLFDGVDRTDDVSKETVGSLASKISSYPNVRLALLEAQRQCLQPGRGLIAEGRDCGTVVFPKADVKVFLTARAEDRAQRRALEEGRSLEATMSDQERRDRSKKTCEPSMKNHLRA